jgi:tetratricopeptide (TPR) repeat protein
VATEASPLFAARNRRVLLVVAAAAAVAAGAVVGATLLQTRGERTSFATRAGRPPLELDFGVSSSPEAHALARAQTLYNRNHVSQSAAIFGRYRSLEAQIGSAFAAWSHGGQAAMSRLATAHPRSGLVLLHVGLADYWEGRDAEAVAAWQKTARVGADSPYGVDAEDLLHPNLKLAGLPYLVLDFQPTRAIRTLPAAKELAALARAAATPDARAKLLYGSALWNLKRPLSAERQFEAAAQLAPHDPVARTAAAVGVFSKADPVRAFGRLGPLTGVFPRSPVVRFHLGLLLLWTGERKKAVAQLRLAAADGPHTVYASYADAVLGRLAKDGP